MLKFNLVALLAFAAVLMAKAAPLTAPTAVHTQPNAQSPVLAVLAPGTDPIPATNAPAATPAGWMAVEQAGPFEAYVFNGDIDKALNVKPGVSIYLKPVKTSGVLTIMQPGDKTVITGLHGKWSRIRLEKNVIGYIRVSPEDPASSPPLAAMNDVAPAPAARASAPAPVPVPMAGDYASSAPVNVSGDAGVLPRLFQGKFVSTRRPFMPRRPYDWQLNDNAGVRYAYLDISKLLLTEQIEKYTDHEVVVYGTPKAASDGKNIVIQVESLRLK
jgi:hypothetical protein